MERACILVLGMTLVGWSSPTCRANFSIDPFSTAASSDQSVFVSGGASGPLSAQSSLADSTVVGGVRNITVTRTSNNRGIVTADVSESASGFFSFGTSNTTTGTATIVYDGSINNTSTTPDFSHGGLGNQDVTQNGLDKGVLFQADSNAQVSVTFTFYTDKNDYFTGTYVIPGDINETVNTDFLNFSAFTKVGSAANLSDVNAITVVINGTSTKSTAMGIAFIGTAPAVPEPASLGLICSGLAMGTGIFARRRSVA